MTGLSVTQKYGSLLQGNLGINKNAEITNIGSQSLQITQRGNSWHGRLVCWVKDNVSPMFRKQSRSPKSGFNSPVLQKLSEDIGLDHSMGEDARTAILDRVSRLDASGVPVRVKHLRKLLKDAGIKPNVIDAKVSLASDLNRVLAKTGSRGSERLNDGGEFEIHIDEMVIGEDEYKTALQELADELGPNDFNDVHLFGKTGLGTEALLEQLPHFQLGGVAALNEDLHEIWQDAVKQKVDSLQSPTISESGLEATSNQVINELCDEIKGARRMYAEDLGKLVGTPGEANVAIHEAMQRTGLEFAENTRNADKGWLRNQVLVSMNKEKISETGHGRLYAKTPQQALDWTVQQFESENSRMFKQN